MQTPLPEDAPPEVPLLVRIGSLAGTGTLAALLGAVPAATRVGPVAGGILSAWIALGASAILPLIAVVAFAQAAREGAKSVAGGDAPLVTWAAATWAMTTFLALAAWGALLRATTHHHGLAGVTFALGGLAIAAVLALLVRRMMQMARAAAELLFKKIGDNHPRAAASYRRHGTQYTNRSSTGHDGRIARYYSRLLDRFK